MWKMTIEKTSAWKQKRRFLIIFTMIQPTVKLVEDYFDNPAAANLLQFVKAISLTLVSLFDMRRDLLANAMDEFTFHCLESLVERIQYDIHYQAEQQEAKFTEAIEGKRDSVATKMSSSSQQALAKRGVPPSTRTNSWRHWTSRVLQLRHRQR